MVGANHAIVHDAEEFSHEHAHRIRKEVLKSGLGGLIVIDLARAMDASTSAFAELVVLRRMLLQAGQDLRLRGLHGRAAHVYEINRLSDVLPVQ